MSTLSTQLIAWYHTNHRSLPWRDTRDPYLIWVSEIILQQTRVEQGLSYYERFVTRFPTVKDLSEATPDEVMKLWQGLGYYSRARNMMTAAQQIMTIYKGIFPNTYEDILALKGIGKYTAAAIASFAFDLPHAVVDGNVYRVLSRIHGEHSPIDTTQGQKLFEALAADALDVRSPHLHNQALMEFGALQCVPRSPQCHLCPLINQCMAYAQNKIDTLPIKQGKTKVLPLFYNYIMIVYKGETYLQLRNDNAIWKGLYQLPLIESDRILDWNELQQTTDFVSLVGNTLEIIKVEKPFHVRHILSHRRIEAQFYTIHVTSPTNAVKQLQQVTLENITLYPVSRLVHKYLEYTGAV